MFPRVWVRKLSLIPCLSWTYNLKGFCKLGNASAGAKTSFSWKIPNVTWQSLVNSKGSESSPFKKLYSGFVIRPKSGIQIWQNLVIPKNPPSCLWISGIFSVAMACFLFSIKLLVPCFSWNPRYATSCLQIWALWSDTLYPLFAKWFRTVTVLSKQFLYILLVINMSSTYYRRTPDFNRISLKSLANTSPNIVEEFLNPCDSRVQQYWSMAFVSRSCHSKVNNSWASSSAGMQKKASFKSKTENHLPFTIPRHHGQQSIAVGHHRMNGLDKQCRLWLKILYKLLLLWVRLFDWQNGSVIRRLGWLN